MRRGSERILVTVIERGRRRAALLSESVRTGGMRMRMPMPKCAVARHETMKPDGAHAKRAKGQEGCIPSREVRRLPDTADIIFCPSETSPARLISASSARAVAVAILSYATPSDRTGYLEALLGVYCGCRMEEEGVVCIVLSADSGLQVVTMAAGSFDATTLLSELQTSRVMNPAPPTCRDWSEGRYVRRKEGRGAYQIAHPCGLEHASSGPRHRISDTPHALFCMHALAMEHQQSLFESRDC